MSLNKVLYVLEVISVFVVSVFVFYFNPLLAIGLLFVYSLFKNTFYTLIIFTFFYDVLFSNILWGLPKMSLIVLSASAIVYYAKKLFFGSIRSRRVDYDF